MKQSDIEQLNQEQQEEFLKEEREAVIFFLKVYIAVIAVLMLFGSLLRAGS